MMAEIGFVVDSQRYRPVRVVPDLLPPQVYQCILNG